MCSAPSIVPEVGCRALIAPVSYVQWLLGAVGGLSIPHRARGVKRHGLLRCAPDGLPGIVQGAHGFGKLVCGIGTLATSNLRR
jgi:hypothetical protein